MYQDAVLICLNSQDAKEKRNGDKNSDLVFDFKSILQDDPTILYSSIAVADFECPSAWYLVDSDTCILNFDITAPLYTNHYQLVLDFGNYNYSNFPTQLQTKFDITLSAVLATAIVSFDIITGKLQFKFSGIKPDETVVFKYDSQSAGLFRLIGLLEHDYSSTLEGGFAYIRPDKPMNLLGIKRISICSQALAPIFSHNSSENGKCIIESVPINVPAWGMVSYSNSLGAFQKLKARTIDNIDIQLIDEFNRYIQLNNTNWTLAIKLINYRSLDSIVSYKPIDKETMITDIQTQQQVIDGIRKEQIKATKTENPPEVELPQPLNDLELLQS